MAEELERIFIIPLKKKNHKSSKAAQTSVKRVKEYLSRHMKVEEKNIWMDDSLNNALWSYGKFKMPSKIRVKAVKFDDGIVETYLPELEFKKSRREILREEKEKKEPILKREEELEGEEGETGAEDYDIAPAADGEVKIKKKKHKEKEEKGEDKKKEEKKTSKKPEKKDEKKTTTKPKAKPKKETEKKKQTKKPSKKPSSKKKESSKPKKKTATNSSKSKKPKTKKKSE
jgi:large subunit ribosomal protein L31e